MKIEKKNKSLEEFLNDLDLANLDKDMLFSDLEDDEPEKVRARLNQYDEVGEKITILWSRLGSLFCFRNVILTHFQFAYSKNQIIKIREKGRAESAFVS